LFSKTVVFLNTSKSVRDIEKTYGISFVGLLIYNNLLFGAHFDIYNIFYDTRVLKISKNTPYP